MPRLIPDACRHGCPPPADHVCDARLVLIGEAPGRREDEIGQPFVGPTGSLLEHWWRDYGLTRADFYITNAYPYRPPANKIQAIPRDQREFWGLRLRERIAFLDDPVLLVPTGNTALNALFPGEDLKITDFRGSILSHTDARGRVLKVIPTIHPAATFRQPILTKFCLSDWKRISEDRHFRELRLPEIQVTVEPSADEFGQFMTELNNLTDPWSVMAVDIENDKNTGELLCVGFSVDSGRALVLPLSRRALFSDSTHGRMHQYARLLCRTDVPKVLQNGQHDAYILKRNDIELANYKWDLMEMDHALDPNDGGDVNSGAADAIDTETVRISMRSLAVLASLYTRFPYYKKGGRRSVKEFQWQNLYEYNGKDCCVTQQIFPVLLEGLLQRGLVDASDSYLPSQPLEGSLLPWASSTTGQMLQAQR